MNTVSGSRLLRKIYIARLDIFLNLFPRCKSQPFCYDIVPLLSSACMSGLAVKQIFLRNFCVKNVLLVSEKLILTRCNLMAMMANPTAPQKLNQPMTTTSMDRYAEVYYNPSSSSSSSSNYGIPFQITGNIQEPCESNVQSSSSSSWPSSVYHQVNTCVVEPAMFAAVHDRETLIDKQRYKAMRQWETVVKTEKLTTFNSDEQHFVVRILSFNILAQCLLETFSYLYKGHDQRALSWENRRQLLLQEILEARANVICLQEMQEDHLPEFLRTFEQWGYSYLYKKRTNDKKDGLLFLYRSDQLILIDHVKVELYQSGIELLMRDNVGIVAKLAVKDNPQTQLVIATTHLLYNPRRNDVRLGQTQLLLAEIERFAFLRQTMTGPKYLPIILTGDFNLRPHSGVYKFIVNGRFRYQGKAKTLEHTESKKLSNFLVPPRLRITDNCQHFNVLKYRLLKEGTNRVMLENSEFVAAVSEADLAAASNASWYCEGNPAAATAENTDTDTVLQTIEIKDGHRVTFCSGTLTHPFRFDSVYKHQNRYGEKEATTNQGKWITVDYIFYSGDLELLDKYTLPTRRECNILPTIPNFAVGSDHLCLGATFKLPKSKL
ncbi:protein angel homolog 2 isoform X2 [Ceratina calcarata]|uniref:Protein angel homolog 2 isoform X2 n=1 Tax=Ceratina calcarata TaxID=156304 RepID=A0AAJ7NAH6_9HYME|nr:protein angel homolog 2 isoform X2 [Ceratina calcarata]